jgi:predicted amidophosphoribosyltransferase
MHVRVCRDCGEEYRPEIPVCADCGGPLEDRDTLTDADAGPPGPRASASERTPPPDLTGHRSVFQTREPRDLRTAAESLREAGLAFHVVETPVQNEERRSTLSLLVRDEDAPSAGRLLAPLHGPEAAAYAERLEAEGGPSSCPACDADVPAGAPECPECGLGLSREGDPGEDR